MKKKISLYILFIIIKSINKLLVIVNKYGLGINILCLMLYKFNLSFYILFLNICFMIILKLSGQVNNVLCIDKFSKSINMNIAINLKNIKGSTSSAKLNTIVNDFVNGLETAALNTKKFKIKEGKTYKFRTHGAIYVLFQRKLIKSNNKVIVHDKTEIDKIVEATKQKKLGKSTLKLNDKLIFIIERMLLQKSFKQMNKFFKNLNLKDIQIYNFEAVFKNNKLYIKSL
ncbi:MAG: hypothetical protein LKF87_14925 [Clostridium tyrobutyricum]|uniref:hypothetical protein n=1 Tax=Clostridium tyrobutyricum TaxID=1519 RepID=UPI0011C7C69F|nr:hypothetical protein [Clostridium tyrobutyricum]MCH4200728.1 hypothetical protein [Clostridium tyrobutyricum]MCH4260208.1 hypothetical protein [Clostridium tyrobutyricum]